MHSFIPLCNDLHPTVFSFLLYNESISLQLTSSTSLKKKNLMNKHCHHIQPHGKIKTFITDTIYKEENYKEGKKEGIQKWCKTDKIMQLFYISNYKKGKREGLQKEWYENGQLMYKKNYKEGKEEGIQKYWYENGQLNYEKNYKEGKPNGIQKQWYFNGQLRYEKNYYNGDDLSLQGKQYGIQKGWYENGQLRYENNYKEGKKNGIQTHWDEIRNISNKEFYKNGMLVIDNYKPWFIDDTKQINITNYEPWFLKLYNYIKLQFESN